MIEIRFHGRGGQGAVVAARVLALALFKEGRHVQSFPAFGVERRGAPVAAFTRIDDKPILLHTNIYEPDHIIVLDPTLIGIVDVIQGLKRGGWVVINSDRSPEHYTDFKKFKVGTVDANKIALSHGLGSRTHPIVNTAILGAFAKVTGVVGLEAVAEAIKEAFPTKKQDNVQAAMDAYHSVRVRGD
ncbi:MAG: pyruvate ferredoxin oxidoreductase [Deltaproteobacteria bacterium]|nr:MAG: pyruvate ferredoxin oxidoreductase [Deltaproteobacteria bacterium]